MTVHSSLPPDPPWPVRPGYPEVSPVPPRPGAPPGLLPGVAVPLTDDGGSDVRSRLLDQRRVLLTGHLDDERATRAAAELMWLDGTGDEPVELHLSCPDGDLGAAGIVADTIDLMGVPVVVRARGRVGGPAVAVLCAGVLRLAAPHTLVELRDPVVRREGRADELDAEVRRHRRAVDGLHRRLAAATGRPVEVIAADAAATTVLDAEEAVAYGLVDAVDRRAGTVTDLTAARRPPGPRP